MPLSQRVTTCLIGNILKRVQKCQDGPSEDPDISYPRNHTPDKAWLLPNPVSLLFVRLL